MNNLYNKTNIHLMKSADLCSDFHSNRIEMIRNFARTSGFKRIGIANCITFSEETRILREYLSKDFLVSCVNCKYGKLSEKDLYGGSGSRLVCNPAGQADFLNQNKTDLNLSIGLCVGHDMIFNSLSNAPVTTLFTKDFSNGHNPAQAVREIQEQRNSNSV